MIFLNQLSFVYGVKLAHASTVALLLGTTPIFIGLISLALRLERLASAFWIGAGITFGGVALIAIANGSVGSSLNGTLISIAHRAHLGVLHGHDRAAHAAVLAAIASARSCSRSAGCRSHS